MLSATQSVAGAYEIQENRNDAHSLQPRIN
jgi:hypothetical protein